MLESEDGARTERMADLMDRIEGFLQPPAHPKIGQIREVLIPIHGTAWPVLKFAFPMTEETWVQMIAVLIAIKPGLVEPKKEDESSVPEEE